MTTWTAAAKLSALAAIATASFNASAVNGFSRACSIGEIAESGSAVTNASLLAFSMVGMPLPLVDQIRNASATEKAKYWVLESFTADITDQLPRYYLYSESKAYIKPEGPVFGGSTNGFVHVRSYKSQWTSAGIHPALLDTNKLGHMIEILKVRRLGFYARAGNEQVTERFEGTARGSFVVFGQHRYYDPATRRETILPLSQAVSCNRAQWGFSWL